MVLYEGIFFEKDAVDLIHSLEKETLDWVKDEIHCTFRFLPKYDELFNELVGKTFEIYLIGYGNDGQNSGFKISLPDELKDYYINYEKENSLVLRTPHITASIAIGAKPKNTKNLSFKSLEKPIKVVGRFGFWIKDGNREYVSYEPYFACDQQ